MKNYKLMEVGDMEKLPNTKKLGWIKSYFIEGPLGGNYLFYRHVNGGLRMIHGNSLNSRARKSAYEFIESLGV